MKTLVAPAVKTDNVKTLQPEVELLLCCARTHLDELVIERIHKLLQNNIDWEYLIRTAFQHGVESLLYLSLDKAASDVVPQPVLKSLQAYFQANAHRNLFLTQKLLKLVNFLNEHDIQVLPFKGPVLAATAYGNLALRKFCDLDILVHRHDILNVKKLLIDQGYQPLPDITGLQEEHYLQSQLGYNFVRQTDGVVIEMHWSLIPKMFTFPLDSEQLWERLDSTSIAGNSVPTLSTEELLIFLCAHGSKDFWRELKWVCDIAELIHGHQDINWDRVMEQAIALGSERRLLLGLLLAHRLLDAPLPEKVMTAIAAEPVVEAIATQVTQWLFRPANVPFRFLERTLFHIQLREKFTDKILFYFRYLTTPIRVEDWAPLTPFEIRFVPYYLRHPLRLLREFIERYVVNPLKFSTTSK